MENQTILRTICHDLANSLTVIMTSIAVSELVKSPEELARCLERISAAAEEQKYILTIVKAMKGVLAGVDRPRMASVDPYDLVDRILFMMEERIAAKKLTVLNSIEKDHCKVLCDSDLLYVLILKPIISNAVKYSPDGGTVVIRAVREKNVIHFTVTDKGVGIPKKSLSGLFDLHHRDLTSGTSGEKGVGLGLPLAKVAIDRCGGSIAVESTTTGEGRGPTGTQVHLYLAADK